MSNSAPTDIANLLTSTDGVTKTGDTTKGDGADWVLDTTNGSKMGTAANQKLGLWGATPVIQPSGVTEATGENGLVSNAVATNVYITNTSNFNGNTGNKAYTINAIVKALKAAGILASS